MLAKDKKSYPRFYRMVPITEQLADGYVALARKLNWNRVAIISYDSDYYLNVCSHIIQNVMSSYVVCKL